MGKHKSPFSIPAERITICIFGANFMIVVPIHYKLSWGQVKYPRIPSQNGRNYLGDQGQWPSFSVLNKTIQWHLFGVKLVISTQICDELSCGQDKFPYNSESKWPKWPFFHYQLRVFHEACLVPIWWFQLKSVTSYHAEKVKFMDGQADGRTGGRVDAGNYNTPFGLKGQGEKWCPTDIGNQFSKGSMGS